MPVADLYAVTASLRNLLRYNIWRIAGLNASVTDMAPEQAEELGSSNLNLHLFHAVEDPSKRNEFARDAQGAFPIRETPLPLILYYVLTAHSPGDEPPDIAGQQRLMGLAMKTFHDFPAFGDTLEMRPPPLPPSQTPLEPVFDAALRGQQNRIEIIPRQLTPEESINFWSAAQNHTARLSAYYDVRSTLLMPDAVEERAGLVTGYGLGVIPGGRPRLTATSSVQVLALPAALGGGTLSTTLSPAEAALGSVTVPSGAQVTATGFDLGDGSAETLLLSGPSGEVEVDPTANPDWEIRISGDRLSLTVRPTALTLRNGTFYPFPIRPGTYTLTLRRRRTLAVSGGPPRSAVTQSNRVPLAVGATVAVTAVLPGPPSLLRIDLGPGTDALALADETEISIGGEVYPRDPLPLPSPLPAGSFRPVLANRIEVALTFDPADGQTRAVRLGISGVDCAPFWIAP